MDHYKDFSKYVLRVKTDPALGLKGFLIELYKDTVLNDIFGERTGPNLPKLGKIVLHETLPKLFYELSSMSNIRNHSNHMKK